MLFQDRVQAGQLLAEKLKHYKKIENGLILALPRGGVVVAAEVAKVLKLPLDVIITRKIGYPGNPEFAAGAVSENGHIFRNPDADVDQEYLEAEAKPELNEIERRIQEYRGGRKLPVLTNKVIILIDDGIATGLTMKAAIYAIKDEKPLKLIVAVPLAPKDTAGEIKGLVDELVCLSTPTPFLAIGQFYEQFPQTEDQEVQDLLKEYGGRG